MRNSWPICLVLFSLFGCRCADTTIPVGAHLSVSPRTLELRPTLVGSERSVLAKVRNEGRSPLALRTEVREGSAFSAVAPALLEPGEEGSVTIIFRPELEGQHSAVLVLLGESATTELALSGEGVRCNSGGPGCRVESWDEEAARCLEVNKEDGTLCTSRCALEGFCAAGTCTPLEALDCNDDNPCTSDSCDEELGCIHADATPSCPAPAEPCRVAVCDPLTGCGTAIAAEGTTCEDGCTVGSCRGGICRGSSRDCDDGNPCTADRCDETQGCVHEDATASCPVPDPCQVAICDPAIGCDTRALADGTPCGPATCQTIHSCQSGQCVAIATPTNSGCGCNDQTTNPRLELGVNSTCRITDAQTIECWGPNQFGQLGDGTYEDRLMPGPVLGLADVAEVTVGGAHACARTLTGDLYCWGLNEHQQVGAGAPRTQPLPYRIPELSNVISVSAGDDSTCAVTADGGIWCWGANSSGEIGDGTYGGSHGNPLIRPVSRVRGINNAVTVSVGEYLVCARLWDSTVKCWGNTNGNLGDGTGRRFSPIPVTAMTPTGVLQGVVELRVSDPFACVRTLFGEVRCTEPWPDIPPPPTSTFPEIGPWFGRVNIGGCATQIAGGYHVGCALLPDTSVRCWGTINFMGAMGTGSTALPPNSLSDVSGLTGVEQIWTSGQHTCALMDDGSYRCWGWNDYGQLGDGTTTSRYAP